MRPLQKLGAFVVSLVIVAATTLVLILAQVWVSTPVIVLLFLLPIILAATRWGLQPALAASLAAFLSFNYFFLDPRYTLSVKKPDEFLALLVFLIVAVLISQLVSTANAHAAQARARELESTTLYNLSRTLSAQAGLDEILSSVTRHVAEVFDLTGCEILLSAPDGSLRSHVRYWAGDAWQAGPEAEEAGAPDGQVVDVSLTANQAMVGVMRLTTGNSGAALEPTAMQMLTTFAAQVGLVVERARLARQAARARLLEESDQLKSALLSSVSHDLRTPLSAIKAAATVLLQQDAALDAAASQDLLSTINEESDRLNRLVGDLLDMSRIEAGALRLRLDWCDLDELIRAVVRRMSPLLGNFAVHLDWPDDLPPAYADYVQVDRVVANLLDNAARFAPPGSAIWVTARGDEAGVTVSVSNEGPAISEQVRAHLFDKFYRISADRAANMGTGLGLSICKGIIEAHGGRIGVESPLIDYQGARFVFTLPFPPGKLPPALPDDEGLSDEKDQGAGR